MAALGVAALTWVRQSGTHVPAAWVPVLAAYGLVHTLAVGFLARTGSPQPELAHFLTVGGLVIILMNSAPAAVRTAAGRPIAVTERQALQRRLRWPAAALMLVGLGAMIFWGSIIVTLVCLSFTARSEQPTVIAYLIMAAGFILGVLITTGATQMSRLGSYRAAALAPWLALFPLGPLGWPAALWAWWALSRPGVRAAFREPDVVPP
jgi:hypothetical protein